MVLSFPVLAEYCIIDMGDNVIFATHGHKYNMSSIPPLCPGDILLCGHTHVPCGYQTNKKQTVVNVGSVGRPMTKEPRACYVIIDIQDGGFSIEHRFVDYDKFTAAEILKMRGFDGAEKLAEMILQPSQRHI